MIETRNLQLISCEPLHLETILKDKKGLEPLLGVSVPDSWPEFPEAMSYFYEKLRSAPSAIGWWTYLFVHVRDGILAGEGGFKGPPDESGTVEIGYAIVPEYRGRGLATEAAGGLVGWALSHPRVAAVAAETLPDGHAPIRVLEKLGMRPDGAGDGVLRWRLERQDFREGGML
ncbi:MAG: Acetyltransferase, GNAT family [uncultured Rubrobacteraceae bacterium]|uniref:Acetyltransferase, GNAT family n=1 Tax=uncultured Rubrobacteraceae bacterium TaxID=349277 RepID=A0A6J4PF51_9ACTN|nr:MAG: Acetyltransferase, GNAT family [uncultured Rubrobacteraceae bacterium]